MKTEESFFYDQRINSEGYVKVLSEPVRILLKVTPSKEIGDPARGKKKNL